MPITQQKYERQQWRKWNETRKIKNALKKLTENAISEGITCAELNETLLSDTGIFNRETVAQQVHESISNDSLFSSRESSSIQKQETRLEKLKNQIILLRKENKALKTEILEVKKRNKKLQKRNSRLKKKLKNALRNKVEEDPSFSTACKNAKGILDQLKQKYNVQRLKKHQWADKVLKRRRLLKLGQSIRLIQKKIRLTSVRNNSNLIRDFYCRDDNSRATAGKKETITRSKLKKQKRFLTDSIKTLFNKFLVEYPSVKISQKTFARYKPFWVVKPSCESRNTCACEEHSNIHFKIQKLFQMKVLKEKNLAELVGQIMCDENSATCAWGICKKCRNTRIPITIGDMDCEVSWFKWEKSYEDKENKKVGSCRVKVIKKIEKHTSLETLNNEFQLELKKFKKHYFNVKTQYQAYRMYKENFKPFEVLIHIDFSENFACKLAEEVQMFHFGASRNQVTIHTGVMYLKKCEKVMVISFATISPNLQHGPAAIWAHLTPVLNYLKDIAPEVTTVHFFSDGPSSQYRQKNNFYLFCKKFFDFDFKCGTWNFFEKYHGKGAADGIGAVLKRTADQLIAQGLDITNAESFFNSLKEKVNIKLFFVSSNDVFQINLSLPNKLKTINGTRNIHQILVHKKGEIKHRNLSCFCTSNDWFKGNLCSCHKMEHKTSIMDNRHKKEKAIYSEIYSDSE